jgi:hypothetical protein
MFSIHSVISDRELVFSDKTGEFFQVEIRGSGLNSNITIWHDYGFSSLGGYFADLAWINKPWDDARKWESLEGDFSISAICSKTGSVTFTIGIFHLAGNEEESRITVGLVSELGQLEIIARDAAKFFGR